MPLPGSHLDLSLAHSERALLDPPPGVPVLSARVAGHQQEVPAIDVDGLAALEVLPCHAAHALTLRGEASPAGRGFEGKSRAKLVVVVKAAIED